MRATGDFQRFFRQQRCPVTMALIVLLVITSVLWFLVRSDRSLFEVSSSWWLKPWSLFTYPFTEPLPGGFGLIFFALLCYWVYWCGSALEAEMGSQNFGLFWLAAGGVSAVFVALGGAITGADVYVAGSMLPVAAITVVWGVKFKSALAMLFGFIPVSGTIIALLAIGGVLVDYGSRSPVIGVVACIPMGIAWLYADNRLPFLPFSKRVVTKAYKPSKEAIAKEQAYFEEIRKREKERDERERLRKLFEGSIGKED